MRFYASIFISDVCDICDVRGVFLSVIAFLSSHVSDICDALGALDSCEL